LKQNNHVALILLLESSAAVCSVALSRNGNVIAQRENPDGNKHAELLSVFCDEVMREANVSPADLSAVAVSGGPGSYTGLRIGASTAKGYCYGLNIPLIAVPTLEAMAWSMKKNAATGDLLCPMIDARRMEVYTAVFDVELHNVAPVVPHVLDENSYLPFLDQQIVWFSGDGMPKAKELLSRHPNARFTNDGLQSARNMAGLAEAKFNRQQFEDTAYYVPFYLKNFQPGPKRSQS
jgi:tRNA threonylcarbamoyladenosine biosynthesis protein TsaB